jgi:hypothetical protein
MHKSLFDDFIPWMTAVQADYVRNYLCRGVPLTQSIKKQWQAEYGLVIPSPTNWRQIALQLAA